MAAKFDLSEETAKAKSEGVKGFKAHKLLDIQWLLQNWAACIATARLRLTATFPIGVARISSRSSVFLLKDEAVETHEFHVIAPVALLDGAKPIAEISPAATEAQKQTADSGLAFTDLPSAAAAFEAALSKIAA